MNRSDPSYISGTSADALIRLTFTPEHIAGVDAVIAGYPGAAIMGFPQAVRDLRARLKCSEPAPEIHFVPDAYRINEDTCEIEIFEVEVTHPIPARKLRDLGLYWSEWDAEGEHDWLPVLIQVDRFGTHHRRDLSIAYFETATLTPTETANG